MPPYRTMPDTINIKAIGEEMYGWASDLFPICRSITGDGVRETLRYIQDIAPELVIHEVPSATRAFDWIVPNEWNIRDAYILDPDGNRIVDFKDSNLHVLGYSAPVDQSLSLDELQDHLHSIPERPDAIPYVTSYYEEKWGFCLSHNARMALKPGDYRAVIDSTLAPGSLSYGEIVLPGREDREILISTYTCHPSLANNEISGPVVTAALARWLGELPDRRYTYRIVFAPETIGAVVYISRNLEHLKKHVIAGFNVTCVGDDQAYSYLATPTGDTLADRVALHVLRHLAPDFARYTFMERASDERQYCAPGVDIPMVSIMRTRYDCYPEYHTSDDDLSVISPDGLGGGFNALRHSLECLEANETYRATFCCEPQLGRRNLIASLGGGNKLMNKLDHRRKALQDVLAYSDGSRDLLEISNIIRRPLWEMLEAIEDLKNEGLLKSL